MNEDTPSFKERLELRVTLSRLDAVFEACNRLPEVDKELLYEEIRKRVPVYAPQAIPEIRPETSVSTEEAPATFIDRCRELADIAPNDKVRNALLMIMRACEAEAVEAAVPSPQSTRIVADRASEQKPRPWHNPFDSVIKDKAATLDKS